MTIFSYIFYFSLFILQSPASRERRPKTQDPALWLTPRPKTRAEPEARAELSVELAQARILPAYELGR